MISLSDPFQGTKYVTDIANAQRESYRKQSADVIGHYLRERSIADAYRGRQILELLQNADDASDEFDGPRRVLFRLTDSHLIAANTGRSFDQEGVQSLVVSDVSPKRLSRQHQIGNKGLGFRSILTWSPAPLIMSGDFVVAFDPAYAREAASALASELPELGKKMEAWRRERGLIPAATMRFPFVPDAADERVRIALDVLKEGYDTVIVLPLAGEPRRDVRGGEKRHHFRRFRAEPMMPDGRPIGGDR